MKNNDNQNRIILDYESICADIESVLDEVRVLRGERYFSRAVGGDVVQEIKEHEATIKKRLRDTFSLVVIGDFKRGKSTLINAILGEDLLPSAVTPETVTINKISYSETPGAEAVLNNGKRATLDYSELKRDVIERLIPQLPAPVDHIDIRADNALLKDISIVDTPGLGDLMSAFDEQVAQYLSNADALIYVASARAPFSASEQAFLAASVIPQSFTQIMVVVNMADILETDENIAKIRNLTMERAANIGENVSVYILSALDELCRKKGMARPEPSLRTTLENNYIEFENALRRDIILQRDIIKSTRCVALTEMMLRDISARIGLVKGSMQAAAERLGETVKDFHEQDSELKKSIERRKTELALNIDDMKAEAITWMREFMSRLKAEIEGLRHDVSMSDVERHFQFFMMDLIKKAVDLCIREHQREISDRVAATVQEQAEEISREFFGNVNAQIADSITDVSWTGTDTAMFFADTFLGDFLGSLGPIYLIGQAVMGFVRQKTIERRQTDFITPILQGYGDITTDVVNNVMTIYDRLKFRALDILEEMYQKQTEASAGAVQKAKELLADENVKKEDVIKYLDTVLSAVDECKNTLAKYK